MDEGILRNEIARLVANFKGNVDVTQTFGLWMKTFHGISGSDFVMAVDKILKDPNQKRFPNVAQVKKKLQEIQKFIPEKGGNCNLCSGGSVVVNVFNYNFAFVCPCTYLKYPDVYPFKCNTCKYYAELYQPSGSLDKRMCTVKDVRIKPAPCEWVLTKFDRTVKAKILVRTDKEDDQP